MPKSNIRTATLADLQRDFPAWDVEPPHHMEANEDCMGGATKPYWRQFAAPRGPHDSRHVLIASAPEDAGEQGCINTMAHKLIDADPAWKAEM